MTSWLKHRLFPSLGKTILTCLCPEFDALSHKRTTQWRTSEAAIFGLSTQQKWERSTNTMKEEGHGVTSNEMRFFSHQSCWEREPHERGMTSVDSLQVFITDTVWSETQSNETWSISFLFCWQEVEKSKDPILPLAMTQTHLDFHAVLTFEASKPTKSTKDMYKEVSSESDGRERKMQPLYFISFVPRVSREMYFSRINDVRGYIKRLWDDVLWDARASLFHVSFY